MRLEVQPSCHGALADGFQAPQDHVDKDGKAGNYEGTDHDDVDQRQVPKPRQIVGHGEIEGNKQGQVGAGKVDTLEIVLEKEGEPGHRNNPCDRYQNPYGVIIQVSVHKQFEREARTVLTQDGYLEGFDFLVADDGPVRLTAYASDKEALETAADIWAVERLRWFSEDSVKARVENDILLVRIVVQLRILFISLEQVQ